MPPKSLILYASLTGNTQKVALRFKQVFGKIGWECDMVKVGRGRDTQDSPVDFQKYDFLCLGSYVHKALPDERVLDARSLDSQSVYHNPKVKAFDNIRQPPTDEEMIEMGKKDFDPHEGQRRPGQPIKIIFGPDSKKGIVFVTYAGEHQGPKEALPALSLLEHELEHLNFQCVGTFSCPGRFAGAHSWFKDLPQRPHERDLMKAQIFLEEILEELE